MKTIDTKLDIYSMVTVIVDTFGTKHKNRQLRWFRGLMHKWLASEPISWLKISKTISRVSKLQKFRLNPSSPKSIQLLTSQLNKSKSQTAPYKYCWNKVLLKSFHWNCLTFEDLIHNLLSLRGSQFYFHVFSSHELRSRLNLSQNEKIRRKN